MNWPKIIELESPPIKSYPWSGAPFPQRALKCLEGLTDDKAQLDSIGCLSTLVGGLEHFLFS